MPIDMTNVKQIMHGGKEVVKIEDSNGHVLWQKGEEYVTGNFTFTLTRSSYSVVNILSDSEASDMLALLNATLSSNIEITSRSVRTSIHKSASGTRYYRVSNGASTDVSVYVTNGSISTSDIILEYDINTVVTQTTLNLYQGTSATNTTNVGASSTVNYPLSGGTYEYTVGFRYKKGIIGTKYRIYGVPNYYSGTTRVTSLTFASDTNIKSQISEKTGIPSSSITISGKTWFMSIGYNFSGTTTYYYKLGTDTSSSSGAITTGTTRQSVDVNFSSNTNISTVYGRYGTSSTNYANNFGSSSNTGLIFADKNNHHYVDIDITTS